MLEELTSEYSRVLKFPWQQLNMISKLSGLFCYEVSLKEKSCWETHMYHEIKSLLRSFGNSQFLCFSTLKNCCKIAITLEMEAVIYMAFNYSFCDQSDVNLKNSNFIKEVIWQLPLNLLFTICFSNTLVFCSSFFVLLQCVVLCGSRDGLSCQFSYFY